MSQTAPRLLLPFQPSTAHEARLDLANFLAQRDIPQVAIDDALVVISELISNAIRHGKPDPNGKLCIGWCIDDDELEVCVCDFGEHSMRGSMLPRPMSETATDGRGLAIVDALAERWWIDDAPGTTIHARIALV